MKAQSGARIEPHDLQQRTGDPHVTEQTRGASPRQLARIAGALYLINIVLGAFATAIVPAIVVVSGDAAATAHNIQTHELLYRLGLVAHLVVTVTNVPLALIFYELFKVVNRRLALLDAFFILVATAIEAAGPLNERSSGGTAAGAGVPAHRPVGDPLQHPHGVLWLRHHHLRVPRAQVDVPPQSHRRPAGDRRPGLPGL